MKRNTLFMLAIIALLILAGCGTGNEDNWDLPDRIAVYDGQGGWHESAVAAKAALENDGRTVDLVDENDIQSDFSDTYGILVMTGEDPREILAALGTTGRFAIQDHVERGGGFIGLGVGCYVAADSMSWNNLPMIDQPLGLYHGVATGPIITLATAGNQVMASVSPSDILFNPELYSTLYVLYRGGPRMIVQSPSASSLGTYDLANNYTAALRFTTGAGRVVLFGVQPEFEENSSRDNTNWGSSLSDPESEWFWLQIAAQWCFHEAI